MNLGIYEGSQSEERDVRFCGENNCMPKFVFFVVAGCLCGWLPISRGLVIGVAFERTAIGVLVCFFYTWRLDHLIPGSQVFGTSHSSLRAIECILVEHSEANL